MTNGPASQLGLDFSEGPLSWVVLLPRKSIGPLSKRSFFSLFLKIECYVSDLF